MKPPSSITEDALNYRGEWVAFSIDLQRVVGHGATPSIATKHARDAEEKHAVLCFIPEKRLGHSVCHRIS